MKRMKKIYFAPETKLVKLKTKSIMMAGSTPNASLINDTVDAEDFESRENSFIQPSSVWED